MPGASDVLCTCGAGDDVPKRPVDVEDLREAMRETRDLIAKNALKFAQRHADRIDRALESVVRRDTGDLTEVERTAVEVAQKVIDEVRTGDPCVVSAQELRQVAKWCVDKELRS